MFDIDDDIIQNSLASGLDLREYSSQIENEFKSANQTAVRDCLGKADKLADLHGKIDNCDKVLENLEASLSGFLDDLAVISVDMKRLKEQSVVINQQLHNRQRVRGELSQFVDDMVVPHTMIKIITEKDVNSSEFLEQLHELQHKLQFLRAQEFKDAKAVGDVHDVIENLKYKAMEKIREWLLLKISLFKKPLTNYQIPQNALLKNRFFYEFLLANERQLAREIKEEYVDTISKMFFSYFKAYVSRLFKLQMADSATKDDLLGAEDVPAKSAYGNIPSLFYSKPHARSRATVFSLGQRQNLLSIDLMAPLIVPHATQQAHETFQFETLFRSIQYALVDHCSHEFLFLCDFFMVNGQAAVDLFTEVMGRTISHLLKALEDKIATNYDAISLFLCICLCTKYSELMAERSVVSIDGYWESLTKTLWARFEAVMNMHNDSVRNLDVRKLQVPVDTRPHYVIRRYAEFTSTFLVCSDIMSKKMDSRLQAMITKQQTEIEGLLNRLTSQLRSKKDRLVFQINNYDVILNVFDERIATESKERSSFWELQQTKINAFVEEILSPHFSGLIQFLNECEPLIEQNHTQLLTRYAGKVTQIVRSFGVEWKRSIESINNEILQSFTNFKNGTNILQMAFTQFIQYYQRLSKVLSHEAFRKSPSEQELVNYQHIIMELKKYKPLY
ncbi:vps52 / sac2 family domain-containing protein [Ditylenchus destructor]|nr:vps52 / sac2 family domain-containing protein [Ditylenchus destructor]